MNDSIENNIAWYVSPNGTWFNSSTPGQQLDTAQVFITSSDDCVFYGYMEYNRVHNSLEYAE